MLRKSCKDSQFQTFWVIFIPHWLLLISGGVKQWSKLFPGLSRSKGTSLSFLTNSPRKGVGLVASAATGDTGGVADISEAESAPRFYSWPDNKVKKKKGN